MVLQTICQNGSLDVFSVDSHTAWIIYVMVFVSRALNRGIKSRNTPALCADVVHVPTTPDALQGPPNWNPANL